MTIQFTILIPFNACKLSLLLPCPYTDSFVPSLPFKLFTCLFFRILFTPLTTTFRSPFLLIHWFFLQTLVLWFEPCSFSLWHTMIKLMNPFILPCSFLSHLIELSIQNYTFNLHLSFSWQTQFLLRYNKLARSMLFSLLSTFIPQNKLHSAHHQSTSIWLIVICSKPVLSPNVQIVVFLSNLVL